MREEVGSGREISAGAQVIVLNSDLSVFVKSYYLEIMKMKRFSYKDISASIVVFLIALPLCLGISVASGVPPISGIIAGVVGGIVVGIISDSNLGVSGPAAGLVAICLAALGELGNLQAFYTVVFLAGILQIILGVVRAGKLSFFFPSSVIAGMLAAIGVIIILKQIPHAFGYDVDYEGDISFNQSDQHNTLSTLLYFWKFIHPGSTFIFFFSILIHLVWAYYLSKRFPRFTLLIQAPLAIVIGGIACAYFFVLNSSWSVYLSDDHFVSIPPLRELIESYQSINFSFIHSFSVWYYAVVIAIVASIETLLCVEATDNLDPLKRITNRDRELVAQGVGNLMSGLLGGLPVTQVIVRSSANISFGAQTKLSTILHGIWLLVSVLLLIPVLNLIPLASLAAILIIIGYKLASPHLFLSYFRKGSKDFIPFIATIVAILVTDLLVGVLIGLFVAVVTQFYLASLGSVEVKTENGIAKVFINDNATFINKSRIYNTLNNITEDSIEIAYKGDDEEIKELIKQKVSFLKHQKNKKVLFNH